MWLNRTVLAIGLASFFSDVSHEAVTVVLPVYLVSFGASAGILGVIEGSADGLATVAKLYGGWLSDCLVKRKPLCVSGYGFMAVAPVVIAMAGSWTVVLAGRVLAWISRGFRTPARKALLAEAVEPAYYGRAFGLERAMDTTGAILAPILTMLALGIGFTHRSVIFASVVPAGCALLAIVWGVEEKPKQVAYHHTFTRSFRDFDPQFLKFLGAVGLFGLGDFADTFFILYAVSVLTPTVGATKAATLSVGFYTLHNVFYAAFAYLGGWACDRYDRRVLLALGYSFAAAGAFCALLGVESQMGLAVMCAFAGAGVGIYEAIEDAFAADLLPPEKRGGGFGLLAVVTGLGDWFSSTVVGVLWATVGVKASFAFALLPMAAGALAVCFLQKSTALRE